jgi:hypothetical protein
LSSPNRRSLSSAFDRPITETIIQGAANQEEGRKRSFIRRRGRVQGARRTFRRNDGINDAPFYLVPAVVNLIGEQRQLIASIRDQSPSRLSWCSTP